MESVGKRHRARRITDPDNRARALLIAGYGAFNAPQLNFGDGQETTTVKLHYELPDGTNNAIVGNSGDDHGHAETDALYQFWVDICQEDVATFAGSTLALACLDKPCCVHCSSILGHLGVLAFPGTHKFYNPAGISYWVTRKVRNLLVLRVAGTNDMVWQYFGNAKY